MKKNFFILLMTLGFKAQADLVLKVGQIQQLSMHPVSVLVGSKKIIEIKNGKVIAKKIGETTLSSQKKYEKVFVLSSADWRLWQQLKNIKTKCFLKNGQVHWTGSLTLADKKRLDDLLQATKANLTLKARVPKAERVFFEKQWRRRLSQFPSSNIQFLWEPYLQLQTTEGIRTEDVLEKLNGFIPPILSFKQKFETQPLVETLVVMTEINRTEAHQMGIEWPTSTSLNLVPKLQGPESLLANIHAMEYRGHGKVLAKPILTAKSGSEAQFLAGGEFPIRMIGRHTKDVIWKQHGITLKIKPTVGLNQQINLMITSEISLLDKSNTVDGIPALKTNRVQSEINVENSQTLALSGLLREDFGTDHSGVFGLGNLPILGPLFRSENFLKSRSELVVFIVPRIKNFTSTKSIEEPEVPFDFE